MKELIFIYNAKSGIFNTLIDWGHKIISPSTYECHLCSITYNNRGKKKRWSNYLKSLKIKSSFYYIDHIADLDFVSKNIKLPCIYIKNNGNHQLMIDANELNSLESLDKLIKTIHTRLNCV